MCCLVLVLKMCFVGQHHYHHLRASHSAVSRPHRGLLNQNFIRIPGGVFPVLNFEKHCFREPQLLLFVHVKFTALIFKVCLQKPHQIS